MAAFSEVANFEAGKLEVADQKIDDGQCHEQATVQAGSYRIIAVCQESLLLECS